MQLFEVKAETRSQQGKGASRRLRREGKVPGILYGAGRETTPILVNHEELRLQLEQEAFFSHILTLHLDGGSERVVLKDLQRHAFRPIIVHVDFQRVAEDRELTMRVPFHFMNEDRCVGVRTGGAVISHILTEVEVSCLPKDLPEYIEVDLADIDVGVTLHLSDLKLPPGVSIYAVKHGGDASAPVVSVHIPRAIEEVEEVPAEAAAEVPVEGVAPAAPAADSAAKPAAAGKPAPAAKPAEGAAPAEKGRKG
jgi:large subunit ribosomal protein L25